MNENNNSNDSARPLADEAIEAVDYRARIFDLLARVPQSRLKAVFNRTKTPEEAEAFFWSKVDIGEPDDCWPWTGSTILVGNRNGDVYGLATINGRMRRSHQYAYEYCKGPIPQGLVIRHTCDVYLCNNPAHLIVGTNQQNMEDAVARNLIPRGAESTFARRPDIVPRGEKSGMSKLITLDIQLIHSLYYRGVSSAPFLSKVFQVAEQQIDLIVAAKTWEHIPLPTWVTPELQQKVKAVYRREACQKRKPQRLTPAMVQEMRQRRIEGWKVKDIARLYKLDASWVSRILRGQGWSEGMEADRAPWEDVASADPANKLAQVARVVLERVIEKEVLSTDELIRLLDRLEAINALTPNDRVQVIAKMAAESVSP